MRMAVKSNREDGEEIKVRISYLYVYLVIFVYSLLIWVLLPVLFTNHRSSYRYVVVLIFPFFLILFTYFCLFSCVDPDVFVTADYLVAFT